MAGKGNPEDPFAWSTGGTPLTPGSPPPVAPRGDIMEDYAPNDSIAPGWATWSVNTPTLTTQTIAAPIGKGDIITPYGDPDTDNGSSGNVAFATGGTPLGLGTVTRTTTGKGDISLDYQAEYAIDMVSGGATWATGGTPIGLGMVTGPSAHGDVMLDMSDPAGDGVIGGATWANGGTALVVGTVALKTAGNGDIADPYAWEDAILYLTSQVYPLLVIEHFTANLTNVLPNFAYSNPAEHVQIGLSLTGGSLTSNLITYSNWPAEHIQVSFALTGGAYTLVLVTYSNWPAEHVQVSLALTGGSYTLVLVTYSNWPAEHVQVSLAMTGGSLT